MDYVKQISKIKYLILNILSFINLETILSIDEGFNAYTDETMEKKKFIRDGGMSHDILSNYSCRLRFLKVHSTQHWLQQR